MIVSLTVPTASVYLYAIMLGIPQGSIIGPDFFVMHINLVRCLCIRCKCDRKMCSYYVFVLVIRLTKFFRPS